MNNKEFIKTAKDYYRLSRSPELSEADSLQLETILEDSVGSIFLEKILYAIDDFLEDQEDDIASEELDRQIKIISKAIDIDKCYSNTNSLDYSDIQYGQWVKKYYYLSKLDYLEEQDEKELETILEMAESNPIVSILIDFLDEIISESESCNEETKLNCEVSSYLILMGISLNFENVEDFTSTQSSWPTAEEDCDSSQFLDVTEYKALHGQSYEQVESIRNRKTSVNVMELVVIERVQHYLTRFSGGLLRDVSVKEIEISALNKLPAIYASSKEGWHHQYSKAKEQFLDVIDTAVKASIYSIVCPSNSKPDEFKLYSVASSEDLHLQALSKILQSPNLSWSEIGSVVAQKLGIEILNEKSCEDSEAGFEYISTRPKNINFEYISVCPKNFEGIDLDGSPEPKPQRPAADRLRRIVCVDDSFTVCQAVEKILDGQGYEATSIGNPLKALGLLFQLQPNLILCDITMPELDGYELCAMLRHSSTFRQTPIVMLTDRDSFSDRVKARMVGATDYLTKPFSPSELLSIVEKYIGPGDLNCPRPEWLLAEVIKHEFDMS